MASLAMSIAKSEFIVGGKYRLMRKIGSGSFGDIYLGINISNGEVRRPSQPICTTYCWTAYCFYQIASSVPSVPVSRFSRLVSRPVLTRLAEPDRIFPSYRRLLARRAQIEGDETSSNETRRKRRRDMSTAICRRWRDPSDRRDSSWPTRHSPRSTSGMTYVRLDAIGINISRRLSR